MSVGVSGGFVTVNPEWRYAIRHPQRILRFEPIPNGRWRSDVEGRGKTVLTAQNVVRLLNEALEAGFGVAATHENGRAIVIEPDETPANRPQHEEAHKA